MPASDPLPPTPADDWSKAPAAPPPLPPPPPPPPTTEATAEQRAYWRANITFVGVLLFIWFTVSCVCGIFLVDGLNEYHLGGFPLGFWFSQQGSVITFILLILTYAIGMGILDRKYKLDVAADTPDLPPEATGEAPPPAAPGAGTDGGAA